MRWIVLLALLLSVGAAHAQQRYAFGPKKGELVETEEQKQHRFQEQSILQLQRIEELLKSNQDAASQQMDLLKQQNQLLTTIIQLQQQQIQQQAAQQLQMQQQQPIIAPLPIQ